MKNQVIKHSVLIVLYLCAGVLLAWYGFLTKTVLAAVLIILFASAAVGAIVHLLNRGKSHDENKIEK